MSLHIALFPPAWPLGQAANGVITYVHLLRKALIEEGHRVTLFSNTVAPEARGEGVELVTEDLRWRLMRRFGRDTVFDSGALLAKHLSLVHRRAPIDVVELEETFGFAAAIKRQLALPVVVKLHGPGFLTLLGAERSSEFGRKRIRQEGEGLAAADAVISPSTRTLASTLAHYRLSPPISEHVVNPAEVPSRHALWSLDHCSQRTFLFVGRFDELKGGDLLLLAFRRLLERRSDARLVFAGQDNGVSTALRRVPQPSLSGGNAPSS
jgi:glycosyltransferase involved in cell wall biosynthesis